MANYTISSYAATELGSDATLNVTGATYNNSTTILHNSITGVTIGMSVVGSGIPVGATVSSVSPSNTSFTLSTSTTGGGHTGETLLLTNIATPTLNITPNDGYVIRAHDFSIHNASRGSGAAINTWTGGDLPSSIASVKFTDTDPNYLPGIGYSESNNIVATINFANDFTINNQDHNISLDINGDAFIYQDVALSIPINFDLLSSLTGVSFNFTSLASGLSWTNNSDGSALSSATQAVDSNISGNLVVTPDVIESGDPIIIAELVADVVEGDLPASEDPNNSNTGVIEEVILEEEEGEEDPTEIDDNVLPEQPGGGFNPGPVITDDFGLGGHLLPMLTMTPKTLTIDAGEQQPNNIVYEVALNPRKIPTTGQRSTFRLTGRAASPPAVSSTKVIRSVDFGKSEVSANGERRVMRVFGDVGAKVNIGIYTDTGTIGTEDGSESANIFNVTNGELTSATTSDRGQGVFTFTAPFPFTSSDKNYGMQISAGTSSSLGSSIAQGGSSAIYDYTFQQFANPTITINATTTHSSGSPSYSSQLAGLQITRVGVANTIGSDLNHVKNKSDVIPINWTLTGVSNLSNPKSLVLDNSNIRNGSFEDGLNDWTATTSGNSTIQAVVDTVNGDYIERTGNDLGDVNVTQAGSFETGRQYTITLEYSGQNKAGGEITIQAGTTSSGAQTLEQTAANTRRRITATLTAASSGNNSSAKILFNKDATARVHSITTSTFSNSMPEENGGTSLRIINSSTTIDGTTVNISGDLKVLKYGNKNAVLNVDVAQLFDI